MDQPGVEQFKISRRSFLKAAAAATAAGAMGGFSLNTRASELVVDDDQPTSIVHTYCNICSANCAMRAELADVAGMKKVIRLQGNPEDQVSQGRLCVKGQTAHRMLYSPDRLKYPMKRTNPEKGPGVDPGWIRISWDEAFTLAASRFNEIRQKYGPESIMLMTRPNDFSIRWARAIGTPNHIRHHDTCYITHDVIWAAMVTGSGRPWTMDLANAKYILSFGWDQPGKGKNMAAREFVRARENGAKAVVVDPRLSTTAAMADEWIPIKPGTDLAFMLAMIHVILKDKLYDQEFVAKYTTGLEELKNSVRSYTPEWGAKLCEVPAGTITRIAREYAATRPSIIPTHKRDAAGPNYANGWRCAQAVVVLSALVGNIDRPGGYILPRTPKLPNIDTLFPTPEFPKTLTERVDGLEAFPLVLGTGPFGKGSFHTVADGILSGKPYPIKAALIKQQNILAFPNAPKMVDALKKLEFIAVIDILPTEIVQMADVVFPEHHFLEGRGLAARSYHAFYPQIAVRLPVHKPLYDTKGFREIIPGLARKMGLNTFFPDSLSSKSFDDAQLKAIGSSWDALAASSNGLWGEKKEFKPKEEFGTPSKKIELVPSVLEKNGYDPLLKWQPRRESASAKYPFNFVIFRQPMHRMTESGSNPAVDELCPENFLYLNPAAAKKLGIQNGDLVFVESRVGKVKIKARLTEGIRPDTVAMEHGFGHWSKALLSYGKGANDGDLIPDMSVEETVKVGDPASGACMSDFAVRVYKA